jgi:hypothetical protein
MENTSTKITTYGESNLRITASVLLKMTASVEIEINY